MGLPFPILTADEAADMIQNGQIIGFSGFTAAGAAKAVPFALAQKARREHEAGRPFKVGVLTGASTGKSLDGALAEAEAINFRAPYQGNPTLRKQINAGKVRFVDMHLSVVAQQVRYGFLGKISWAVVEACDVTAGGGIVLSTSVGNSNTYLTWRIRSSSSSTPSIPRRCSASTTFSSRRILPAVAKFQSSRRRTVAVPRSASSIQTKSPALCSPILPTNPAVLKRALR